MDPVDDFTYAYLRHRKWILPARVYPSGYDAERWYYSVGDDPFAVSFTVHTGRYPENRGPSRPPQGFDRSWHRTGTSNPGCLCLSGAACTSDGTALGAMEWYDEQPKDEHGFVDDAFVFAYLRTYYAKMEP